MLNVLWHCVNAALGAGFSKHLAVGAAEPVNVDALARSSARDTLLVSSTVETLLPSVADPGWLYRIPFFPSRIQNQPISSPDPHQRFLYFQPNNLFLSSRKYVHPGFGFFSIPDPDPQHCCYLLTVMPIQCASLASRYFCIRGGSFHSFTKIAVRVGNFWEFDDSFLGYLKSKKCSRPNQKHPLKFVVFVKKIFSLFNFL